MHFEKSIAFDRDIPLFLRLREFAGRENFGGSDQFRAVTDLHAGRKLVARACFSAGRARILIKQILELGFALFETSRVDVREVVRDDVEIGLLALHAGG